MKLTLLLLCLLTIYVSTQSFDAVLALSWLNGHCEYLSNNGRHCDPALLKKWDHKSFTIHGFWPQTVSTTKYGAFDLNAVKGIETELNLHWPPMAELPRGTARFQDKYFLWIHEWDSHGSDFANIYSTLNGKSLPADAKKRDSALQTIYFSETLKLFKTIKARGLAKNPKTQQQLAQILGVSAKSLVTRCNPSGNLQQIRICTKISKIGASIDIKVIDCRKGSTNCKGTSVVLDGFK